jgi:hypothetical protein
LQVGLNLRIQLLHVRHPPLQTARSDEQEHSERYEQDVQDGKFTRRPHRPDYLSARSDGSADMPTTNGFARTTYLVQGRHE